MQSFPQSVAGIEIEDRLNLGRRFIREVDESLRQDTGINTDVAPFSIASSTRSSGL